MKFYKFVLALIAFLPGAILDGQNVRISGTGEGYENALLRFYTQTDPVTKRFKPVLIIPCDKRGAFSCEIPCVGREVIYIKTGIYVLRLYVKESSEYELLLPVYIPKNSNEEQNPFFIETELIPEVTNDNRDLNNRIKAFDYEYNPVFNLVAERVFRNYKKEDILNEVSKLSRFSETTPDEFFNDYVSARMAMLNNVFSSKPADLIKTSEFINASFNPDNQAFLELAEQMFSGYFSKLSSGDTGDRFNRALAIASYPEMRSVIRQDGKISDNELADFVTLLNLNEGYYNRTIPGENTRKIISLMKTQGSTDFIKKVAGEVLGKINSSLPGSIPTDFTLSDSDGRVISMKDFRGKYLLLCFARSDSQASVMEMGIVNMWQKKYLSDLTVVTILTDYDFNSGKAALQKRGFNWAILDGSKREMIEFSYEIKMYPSFMLLDREGRIIAAPAPFPSENLEAAIVKILGGENSGSATK